jgi:hypothetical protein
MAIDFPDTPEVDDEFTAAGRTWKWNGYAWVSPVQQSGGTVQAESSTPHPFSLLV